jgi:plastocyanin
MLLAGCTSSGSDAAGAPGEVDLKDSKYAPSTLNAAVGDRVTWTNRDDVGHTVTPTDSMQWGTQGSGDDTEKWLLKSQSWRFTFTKAGTYEYYCIPHAWKETNGEYAGMVGIVVVK